MSNCPKFCHICLYKSVLPADVEDSLQSLCQLNLLRHLDVSQCTESRGHFKNPTHFLESLVTSLPYLESLDISGTNLAGTGGERNSKHQVICDIPGLSSRYLISLSNVNTSQLSQ